MTRNRVPEDLRRWFEGHDVIAEEYGLTRISFRHRVVEVLANLEHDDGRPWIAKGEWREFKDPKAAEKLRDAWAAEGRTVILQHAVVWWLTEDELPTPYDETPDDVERVLGEDAVHCEACGGWHHRLYHVPRSELGEGE